jgi:vacuolar-type H+-ATPase subunit H
MRDVIQKIIAAEKEARLIVEKAKAEADHILSDAKKRGQDLGERSRQQAFIEAEKIVEAAVETAEREKRHRLVEAAAEIEKQIQLEPATREWAVTEVVRCVCKKI